MDRRRGGKQSVGGTEQSRVPDTVPEQLVLITAASKTEGSSRVRGRVPTVGVRLSG